MSTTQGIKLDDETRSRLKTLAKKRDRSPHWLMRTAIERYLKAEENYEREKSEDMERYQQYQLTGRTISNETAIAWLSDLSENRLTPCPE